VLLTGAKYTVTLATIVSRHCYAGGETARDVEVPVDVHAVELLAVACMRAYHDSALSSCNLERHPPLVAAAGGQSRELVRRETVTDLLSRDRGWSGPSAPPRRPM